MNRIRSENIREKVGVALIIGKFRETHLRYYDTYLGIQ